MPAFVIQVAAASYAALFAAAAIGKATAWRDWSALAADVAGKRALLVRLPVPVGEGALAVVLVLLPVAGLSGAAGALAVFAVAVMSVRGRLAGRDCGCFGRFSRSRFSGRLAARNAVLAAGAALLAVAAGRSGWHPVSWWSCVAVLSGWAAFTGVRAAPSLLARLRTPEPFVGAGRAGEAEAASTARPSPELFSRRRLVGEGARVVAGVVTLPPLLRLAGRRRGAAMCAPCVRVRCSCNKKLYDEPRVCLDECKPGLGCFIGICNPVPSDKFHCGSKCCEPGQKCVGGSCVDSCPPEHKPCGCTCCPPEQTCKGNLCMPKKMCGPDITDALGDALDRTKAEFGKWSSSDRDDACENLVLIPWATFSWDITQLSPAGRQKFTEAYGPECSSCGFSVQVGSDCHFDGSANYVVYGTMMRLCHDHYKAEDRWKAGWHTEDYMILLIAAHKSFTGRVAANVGPAAEWASAGYRGWPGKGKTPGGDRPDCETGCPNKYSGPGLTVQWYPHVIRP